MAVPVPPQRQALMGAVPRTSPKVRRRPDAAAEVASYPHLVWRELIAFLLLLAVLLAMALVFNAPLEDKADPALTPNPAKAPWYFVGLQELLHYFHPFLAGILVPGVLIGLLVALPYLDRNPSRRPLDRRLAITLWTVGALIAIVLIVIGQWFRGPGWHWVWPW